VDQGPRFESDDPWLRSFKPPLTGLVPEKGEGGRGRVLPEKYVVGVGPTSQNPYPIFGQKLRFSLPYL